MTQTWAYYLPVYGHYGYNANSNDNTLYGAYNKLADYGNYGYTTPPTYYVYNTHRADYGNYGYTTQPQPTYYAYNPVKYPYGYYDEQPPVYTSPDIPDTPDYDDGNDTDDNVTDTNNEDDGDVNDTNNESPPVSPPPPVSNAAINIRNMLNYFMVLGIVSAVFMM
jgi:hypothetical protein